MHGGEIEATSEGLGHGSTFRVRLPLIDRPPESAGEAATVTSRPRRVLVVDDNADAADSLALLLGLQGHQTESVHGAHQAIERARAFAPDVVLLDIGLPEMDGYEVARRLRAEGTAGVLIALTGYAQPEDVRRAEAAGFDAHVTKPVAFSELARVLEEHGGGRGEGPSTVS
jgi:CheY-like chemotaxis protein